MRQNGKPFCNLYIAAARSLPPKCSSHHAIVGEERLTKPQERLLSPRKLRLTIAPPSKALGGKKLRSGD